MASVVITGDTSGSITVAAPAVAGSNTLTLPANTGTIISTASTFAGTGPAFSVYMSANQVPSNNVLTKCALDTEVFDTANCFNTSTYRFTPNVAGYYFISGAVSGYSTGTSLTSATTALQKNGANFAAAHVLSIAASLLLQPTASGVIYLNGSTDYVELYGQITAGSNSQLFVGTSQLYTVMSGCLVRAA